MDCHRVPNGHKKCRSRKLSIYVTYLLVLIFAKPNCRVSPGGTGVLWWLYAKQRRSPKEAVIPEQLQIAEDNLRALLIYAISATVFTVSGNAGGDLSVVCMWS